MRIDFRDTTFDIPELATQIYRKLNLSAEKMGSEEILDIVSRKFNDFGNLLTIIQKRILGVEFDGSFVDAGGIAVKTKIAGRDIIESGAV